MSWKSILLLALMVSNNLFCNGLDEQRRKSISGQHLKLAYIEMEGMIARKIDPTHGNHSHHGILVELWSILGESMNFTYSFVEVIEKDYRKPGQLIALLEPLIKREVDAIAFPEVPSAEMKPFADFTFPVIDDPIVLLQPMPKKESGLFAVFKPFSIQVWFSLGFCIVFVAIVLNLIDYASDSPRTGSKWSHLAMSLNYISSMLIDQGGRFYSKKLALRIIAAAWCLAAVILLHSFKGKIKTALTLPNYEPVLNTWEELAVADSKEILILKSSSFHEMIKRSDSDIFRRLDESLERNPHHQVANLAETRTILATGCCAVPVPLRIGHIALEILTSRQSGECALTIGSRLDGGTVKMASLFLQKNSPYTETFNEKIILLSETGLLKKSYSENGLKPTVQRCVQRQVTRVKQSAISLYDLYSTFIVLGIGISLSILAFLVELIMARLGRGRQG